MINQEDFFFIAELPEEIQAVKVRVPIFNKSEKPKKEEKTFLIFGDFLILHKNLIDFRELWTLLARKSP